MVSVIWYLYLTAIGANRLPVFAKLRERGITSELAPRKIEASLPLLLASGSLTDLVGYKREFETLGAVVDIGGTCHPKDRYR